eukprot:m.310005 g.310005  ORF g.310005 m.310005 type:complete len:180 (+) comp49070_c0_seq1:26-565(+)
MALSSLEKRIHILEESMGSLRMVEKEGLKSCAAALSKMSSELYRATATKEHISQLFSKQRDLAAYIDPDFEKKLVLTETVKIDVIAASEDLTRQTAKKLQQIDQLSDTLDPKTLKDLPRLSERLRPLVQAHITQQAKGERISKESAELLTTYNKFISTISHQLADWDQLLRHYEEQYSS